MVDAHQLAAHDLEQARHIGGTVLAW
jgi:hypothetical protein